MKTVRTRIAPSPTGDPHVGTAYIALFNRCFAHQHNGKFILRIEDTDQQRSSVSSEKKILKSLQWLGLTWDEGPDIGGPLGPYRQSERTSIYQQQIQVLLEKGSAFRCFCTPERLAALRETQQANKQTSGYDGHCLSLSQAEIAERLTAGISHVVRMRVPDQGDCVFHDFLRGEISIPWSQIDMQVLMKSDGLPTYHFANVVDDHLMQITHVIRGEEWINSTPKHLLLYQYFDWAPPEFCHMPLLRNPDKSKLSKRKNPTSIFYYRDMGYLPEAVVNYLGMMGWTMPNGEEKFSLSMMTEHFELARVSLGGPVFDLDKLGWLNGKYIREDLNDVDFVRRYAEWLLAEQRVQRAAPLVRQRVEKFTDVEPLSGFLLNGLLEIQPSQFTHKTLDSEAVMRVLQFLIWKLEQLDVWTRDSIESMCLELAGKLNLKIRDFLFPVFVAITGRAVSLSVVDAIAILGLDISRVRLRNALDVMGGVSKKFAKELEKEFANLGETDS